MQVEMFVHKRNGTKQEWVREKMIASMVNAGVTKIQAGLIASLLQDCLSQKGVYEVESMYLRTKIIAILRVLESNSADAYEYFSSESQTS